MTRNSQEVSIADEMPGIAEDAGRYQRLKRRIGLAAVEALLEGKAVVQLVASVEESAELVNGPIRMDLLSHEVTVGGRKVWFTRKEYALLRFFLTHAGRMMPHREIMKAVWGPAQVDDLHYLRIFVSQIREKIEPDPSLPRIIVTEKGVGYRMEILSTQAEERQG